MNVISGQHSRPQMGFLTRFQLGQNSGEGGTTHGTKQSTCANRIGESESR